MSRNMVLKLTEIVYLILYIQAVIQKMNLLPSRAEIEPSCPQFLGCIQHTDWQTRGMLYTLDLLCCNVA